jgi:carboxylesterase type B
MTEEETLARFGLPADIADRAAIQAAFIAELARSEMDHELILCLAVQLFSIGDVSDSLLIWQAKRRNMDLGWSIDVQLLCGAGVEATRSFLSASQDARASQALDHLESCIADGDFENWTAADWISGYQSYYDLDGLSS